MKIVWSDFAAEMLKEIFIYHKEIAGNTIARRILTMIFNSTRQLKQHPNSGQIEPALIVLKEGHRYIVVGNYKVIYKKVSEGILITDVFDTRQNPAKLNNPERKPSK
jgi:plasmid stabilization system protein ParE